ncbi:MAG: acyl carrier protein [Desulfovibrionaceae bacterium]
MTSAQALERMQDIFRDVLDVDDIVLTTATTADDIEEWDSLSHINLVVALEQDFGLKFALGELQTLKNVGDMAELIVKKLG